ncbi:MAG: GGDEF domain-containing protein [Gammaproteobacteria bacterium]
MPSLSMHSPDQRHTETAPRTAPHAAHRTAVATADLLAALAEAKQQLAHMHRETRAAARRIAALEQSNGSLQQTVERLAAQEAQARVYAYHDELTGLPNRRLLKDRLTQALAQGARQEREVVLILIDLDDFKSINDRLGHALGDQVLCMVAARLIASTRGADTACRYGGDEFVVMLPATSAACTGKAVLRKLQQALIAPYRIDDVDICMHASLGVVAYPGDGDCQESLLAEADRALYRAKAARSRIAITARPSADQPERDPAGGV